MQQKVEYPCLLDMQCILLCFLPFTDLYFIVLHLFFLVFPFLLLFSVLRLLFLCCCFSFIFGSQRCCCSLPLCPLPLSSAVLCNLIILTNAHTRPSQRGQEQEVGEFSDKLTYSLLLRSTVQYTLVHHALQSVKIRRLNFAKARWGAMLLCKNNVKS